MANTSILVVGGGFSGLTAALDAADVGHEVFIVEKNPFLGGRVAQLNKYVITSYSIHYTKLYEGHDEGLAARRGGLHGLVGQRVGGDEHLPHEPLGQSGLAERLVPDGP